MVSQSQPENPSIIVKRRPRRYLLIGLLALILALVAALISAYGYSAYLLNPVRSAPVTASPNTFDGRYLLTVSDADMVGTAYADGVLMQVAGLRDTLSVLPLPIDYNQPQLTEVFASNSVTSWPQVLVASLDGERAYIIETAAEIPDDVTVLPDVLTNPPNGRSLTVVELATGEAAVYDVMDRANHLAVHPQERFVAVGSAAEGEQLGILPVATLDDATTYQFFTITNSDNTPASELTSVHWHPNGEYLAVGIDRSELGFYQVVEAEDGTLSLRQHGELIVNLGNTITYGQFTTDGRHYLTAEINWAAVPGQLGFLFNPRGEMISVAFDATASAQHRVVSRVEVGQSPEGFAINPAGDLIVTVDMRRTYLPDSLTFVPGTDLNSLSLLTFDNESGELTLIDQYGFEGVLPEHAAFDADGDALGVVVYNARSAPNGSGYIEFWNVDRSGSQPALARTGARVDVVRGPHTIVSIP